jgi:hypothetical protein
MFKKGSIAVSACVIGLCCGFGFRLAESRTQDLQTVNITAEDYPKAFQNKEPVKIVGLYLGTTPVKSGEDFQAGKDWLRDLRIMVKNVSDQSIREIILYLDLPTNDPKVGVRRIEIQYGRGYFTSRAPDTTVPDVLLPPRELATIYYDFDSPNSYAHLMTHLSQDHHYSLPSKGSLFLGAVVFEDIDKGWYAPNYVLRSEGGWARDPSKLYSIGGTQRQTGLWKKKDGAAMMKASFASGKPLPQSWDYPDPPNNLTTQEICTLCPTCKYSKPMLNEVAGGYQRFQGSAQCYHTVFGSINLSDPCACCQALVWQLSFGHGCP